MRSVKIYYCLSLNKDRFWELLVKSPDNSLFDNYLQFLIFQLYHDALHNPENLLSMGYLLAYREALKQRLEI